MALIYVEGFDMHDNIFEGAKIFDKPVRPAKKADTAKAIADLTGALIDRKATLKDVNAALVTGGMMEAEKKPDMLPVVGLDMPPTQEELKVATVAAGDMPIKW